MSSFNNGLVLNCVIINLTLIKSKGIKIIPVTTQAVTDNHNDLNGSFECVKSRKNGSGIPKNGEMNPVIQASMVCDNVW